MSRPKAQPDPGPGWYPIAVIADLFDLTVRRVQQLATEGVIPNPVRGKCELVPTIQHYVRDLKRKASGGEAGAQTRDARTGLLAAQRAKVEMAVQRLRGDMVERASAERTVFAWASGNAKRWLVWPARVASRIAGECGAEPARLAIALEREIRVRLNEESDYAFTLADGRAEVGPHEP